MGLIFVLQRKGGFLSGKISEKILFLSDFLGTFLGKYSIPQQFI
jgi:hypothetical protein